MKTSIECAVILLFGNVLFVTNGLRLGDDILEEDLSMMEEIETLTDIINDTCEVCKSGKTKQSIDLENISFY